MSSASNPAHLTCHLQIERVAAATLHAPTLTNDNRPPCFSSIIGRWALDEPALSVAEWAPLSSMGLVKGGRCPRAVYTEMPRKLNATRSPRRPYRRDPRLSGYGPAAVVDFNQADAGTVV